nr:FtsK/SpoIIIE domain-containing protein [Nakamurella flavida]
MATQAGPVPPLTLPLTVRTPTGDTHLVVHAPGPVPFDDVRAALLRTAGLPDDAVVHHGLGPVPGAAVLGRPPLLAGLVLSTLPGTTVPVDGPVILACVAGPDAGAFVALDTDPVVVGRHTRGGLDLADPELSRRHLRIERHGTGWRVVDLGSANGVEVGGAHPDEAADGTTGDGARTGLTSAHPVAAASGSLIRAGGSRLRIVVNAERRLPLTPDGVGHLRVARPPRVLTPFQVELADEPGPPPERVRRPLPLLAAALGAIVGAIIAWVTGMWMFLLFAALGPVYLVAGALGDRVGGRRGHRRAVVEHRRRTGERVASVAAAVLADREDAWDRFPDPALLARRCRTAAARLWERRPTDPEFAELVLAVGDRAARLPMPDPPRAADMPLTISLLDVGVLGLTGQARATLRSLLVQLVALHSPADIGLVVFTSADDLLPLRDLPHTADGRPGADTLVRGAGRVTAALDELAAILASADRPALTVLVLDGAGRWRRQPGMARFLAAAADPRHSGLAALCLEEERELLPAECRAVADVSPGGVLLRGGPVFDGGPVGVSVDHLAAVVAALAPLRDTDAALGALPAACVLGEWAEIGRDGEALRRRWRRPSVRTVIGVGRSGPVEIDLDRDGPHLLIAGTTGAGKSELLQTLVVGLAAAAPPSATSFLLVDYKGGAAFAELGALPHTAGLITDLDPELAARALTSLRAELRGRESALASAGVADLAAWRAVDPGAPGRLVVVVDEFATLATELPEFLAGLLDIGRRGRSLGLHLILATQRPAGVVTPALRANIGTRICLRVSDDAESRDVLEAPDAARLPRDRPGRALLRTDSGRLTVFQAARVTVRPDDSVRVVRRDGAGHPGSGSADRPGAPAHSGTGGTHRAAGWTPVRTGQDTPRRGGDPGTDLTALLGAARRIAPVPARRPWLPALPPTLTPEDLVRAGIGVDPDDATAGPPIGLIDRPEAQQQSPFFLPAGSTLVVGPPGSGRSTALRACARAAAEAGAELLVVDTTGALTDLASWPCTTTALDDREPALLVRLVDRLRAELATRAHPAARAAPLVLVVDGWETVVATLDAVDYGAAGGVLAEIVARGPALGVRVVASGTARTAHSRHSASFTTVLSLGDPDRFGQPRADAPPGRARFGAHQLQLLLVTPGAPSGRPVSGTGQVVVRRLPMVVPYAALPPVGHGPAWIGLGGDDAAPVGVDLSGPGGGFLVTGPRRSGVTTVLQVLAQGALHLGVPVVELSRRAGEARTGGRVVPVDPDGADLEELLARHEGPLLLVVDELDTWSDHPAAALLTRFLAVAGPGQHLAAGCRTDRAHRGSRGLIGEIAAFRHGVLLQADTGDGAILDAVLPRRRTAVGVGRGHLVHQGRVIPVQIATRPGGPVGGPALPNGGRDAGHRAKVDDMSATRAYSLRS